MAAHVRNARNQRRAQAIARRPRLMADRSNPLEDLDRQEVFRRYRFLPETIYYLLNLLPNLRTPTMRNSPLPPVLQLLLTLRFLATGGIHILVGDSLSVSRSTAGRCIRRVAGLLCRLARRFVKFPDRAQSQRVKEDFASVAGIKICVSC